MDLYSKLCYMETSCQLLRICEEITSLIKQKEAIERKLKQKQCEEAELWKINLRFIKIIQKTKGADNYSPQKRGHKPCTPLKNKNKNANSTSDASTTLAHLPNQPTNAAHVKKALVSDTHLGYIPMSLYNHDFITIWYRDLGFGSICVICVCSSWPEYWSYKLHILQVNHIMPSIHI